MIEVRDLCKDYGNRNAISDISFSVKKGEVVGLLGPNGAGKTTTMKIVTGYMAPTSGQVKVAGLDVFEDPVAVKRKIGYLPETPPLYPDMTVEHYLRFVANLKGVEKKRIPEMVDRALQKTDLGSVRKRIIQNLSKGYRQRVGVSQALVSDPEILILDEPTVGLDPRQVAEIRTLIKELSGQHTIVLSTHILPEVQATCERIIIINRGRIVAEDTLDGLSRRMNGSGRVALKVRAISVELKKALGAVLGVAKVQEGASPGLLQIDTDGRAEISEQLVAKVMASGAGLIEIKTENFNLEDVFLQLTNSEEQQEVTP